MEKVIIHKNTFCKDFNNLIKTAVADMRKKNPELDKKIKEFEEKSKREVANGSGK